MCIRDSTEAGQIQGFLEHYTGSMVCSKPVSYTHLYDAKDHDPPRRRPVRRKISEELRYRQAEQKCFRVLCDYLHLLERWEKEYACLLYTSGLYHP